MCDSVDEVAAVQDRATSTISVTGKDLLSALQLAYPNNFVAVCPNSSFETVTELPHANAIWIGQTADRDYNGSYYKLVDVQVGVSGLRTFTLEED